MSNDEEFFIYRSAAVVTSPSLESASHRRAKMNETSFDFALSSAPHCLGQRVLWGTWTGHRNAILKRNLFLGLYTQLLNIEMRISVSSQQVVAELGTNATAETFSSSLFLPTSLEPNLEEALRHVLSNPGSLIRPNLVIQMTTAYGMSPASSRDFAIALEYFHTASLLFDDLPCMDNALERRGAPCTHLIYGEESAILAALALINRAYALLWRAVASCPTAGQSRALSFVEQCLGLEGLLNGQSLDLHFSSLPRTLETTDRVARAKTVSMIRLTLVLPAILGGAAACEVRQIERISSFWGLGYQIVDDLKDLLQSASQAGKTTARDALLGHPNVAAVIGVDRAVHRLTRLMDMGDRVLDRLLRTRPELSFLKPLRSQLQTELANVLEGSHALVEEAG